MSIFTTASFSGEILSLSEDVGIEEDPPRELACQVIWQQIEILLGKVRDIKVIIVGSCVFRCN